MPTKLTDMINEFDATLNSKEEVSKSTEEEVVEVDVEEKDTPETTEEALAVEGEADANTEAETVAKSEDAKEDKEADKKDEDVEKAEDEEADKKDKKEDVKKSDSKDEKDEEEDKKDKKADSDKKDDEKADKEDDKVEKSNTVDTVTDTGTLENESLLKSEDILGAFEVVMKGITQLHELQASLAQTVTTLAVKTDELVSKSNSANVAIEEINKSLETEKEEAIAKSLDNAVPTEGKAVGFVQKSVDATAIEAPAEPDVEVVADNEQPTLSLTERTHQLRGEYMDAFKNASVRGHRGEVATVKEAYLRLGQGYGTDKDFETVNTFIEKFK